jgi:hypothetical protein
MSIDTYTVTTHDKFVITHVITHHSSDTNKHVILSTEEFLSHSVLNSYSQAETNFIHLMFLKFSVQICCLVENFTPFSYSLEKITHINTDLRRIRYLIQCMPSLQIKVQFQAKYRATRYY